MSSKANARHSARSGRAESDVYQAVSESSVHDRPLTLAWGRLLTDRRFAIRALRYVLHLPTPLHTEDRRVLEQAIIPYYSRRPDMKIVLFVGCQWYTRHYRAYFRRQTYWTIDPSESARRYAGAQHVVAPLERLDEFFPEDFFDLIICNGVYGFGLDSPEQCERAFRHCHSRLRPGGHLVFGWTNVPARTPVPLDSIASLGDFTRFCPPLLATWRYETSTPYRHTYDFYTK